MALTLSKTNILTGNVINASDVTQSIDAFTKQEAYDITLSGSFQMTGSHSSLNGYTGSLLGTSSWAVSSSFAVSASISNTTNFASSVSGLVKTSGSPTPIVNPQIQVSIGASQTGNTPPYQAVVDVGISKTLGQSSFITATPYSGSISATPGIWVVSQTGTIVIFETQSPDVNFNYQVLYI
jgi:ribosomal protein L21E